MFVGWRIFAIIETGRGSVMQRWRWLCIGANGESGEADRGFATVLACRADAFKHGLNPDTPVQVAPLTSQLDCLVASATMDGATPTRLASTHGGQSAAQRAKTCRIELGARSGIRALGRARSDRRRQRDRNAP
jgi:hypothetical protein